MQIIPTRKFSAGIPPNRPRAPLFRPRAALFCRSKTLLRDQRGQGILEYLLVLIVVLGVVFVGARPVIARLQGKFEKALKGGIFREDPSGSNFYYFPLK